MRCALLLFAVLLLPGCLSGTGQWEPPERGVVAQQGASPDAIPWSMTDCRFVNWFVPVPREALEPFLPAGFEPAPYRGLPGPAIESMTYLGFEAFECAEGTGLDGPVAPLAYASAFTSVFPPDAYRDENESIGLYLVKWDTLIPDAPRRDVLAQWGLPVHAGTAEASAQGEPVATARFALEGVGAFAFTGLVREETPSSREVPFVEFTPTPEGLATWETMYRSESIGSGVGTWEAATDSWIATVLGASTGVADFITGTWSFENGSISRSAPPMEGAS